MSMLSVDLDKINLDDDNIFCEEDPETIVYIRLLAWHNNFEKLKAFKKGVKILSMWVTSI